MANSDDDYSDVALPQGLTAAPESNVAQPVDNDFSLGSGSPLDSENYDSSAYAQRPSNRTELLIRNAESSQIPPATTSAPRSAFVTGPAPQPAVTGKGKGKKTKDRSMSFDSTGRRSDGNKSSSGREGRKSSSSDNAKSQGKKKKQQTAIADTATSATTTAQVEKPKKKKAQRPQPVESTAHALDDPGASDTTIRRSARASQPTNFFSPDDHPPPTRAHAPTTTEDPIIVDVTADHSSVNEDPPSNDEQVDHPQSFNAPPAHDHVDLSRTFASRYSNDPQGTHSSRDHHRDSRDRRRDTYDSPRRSPSPAHRRHYRRDSRDRRRYAPSPDARHTDDHYRRRRHRHRSNSRSDSDSDRSRRRSRSRSHSHRRDPSYSDSHRSRSPSPHRDRSTSPPTATRSSARIADAATQRANTATPNRAGTAAHTRYNPDNPADHIDYDAAQPFFGKAERCPSRFFHPSRSMTNAMAKQPAHSLIWNNQNKSTTSAGFQAALKIVMVTQRSINEEHRVRKERNKLDREARQQAREELEAEAAYDQVYGDFADVTHEQYVAGIARGIQPPGGPARPSTPDGAMSSHQVHLNRPIPTDEFTLDEPDEPAIYTYAQHAINIFSSLGRHYYTTVKGDGQCLAHALFRTCGVVTSGPKGLTANLLNHATRPYIKAYAEQYGWEANNALDPYATTNLTDIHVKALAVALRLTVVIFVSTTEWNPRWITGPLSTDPLQHPDLVHIFTPDPQQSPTSFNSRFLAPSEVLTAFQTSTNVVGLHLQRSNASASSHFNPLVARGTSLLSIPEKELTLLMGHPDPHRTLRVCAANITTRSGDHFDPNLLRRRYQAPSEFYNYYATVSIVMPDGNFRPFQPSSLPLGTLRLPPTAHPAPATSTSSAPAAAAPAVADPPTTKSSAHAEPPPTANADTSDVADEPSPHSAGTTTTAPDSPTRTLFDALAAAMHAFNPALGAQFTAFRQAQAPSPAAKPPTPPPIQLFTADGRSFHVPHATFTSWSTSPPFGTSTTSAFTSVPKAAATAAPPPSTGTNPPSSAPAAAAYRAPAPDTSARPHSPTLFDSPSPIEPTYHTFFTEPSRPHTAPFSAYSHKPEKVKPLTAFDQDSFVEHIATCEHTWSRNNNTPFLTTMTHTIRDLFRQAWLHSLTMSHPFPDTLRPLADIVDNPDINPSTDGRVLKQIILFFNIYFRPDAQAIKDIHCAGFHEPLKVLKQWDHHTVNFEVRFRFYLIHPITLKHIFCNSFAKNNPAIHEVLKEKLAHPSETYETMRTYMRSLLQNYASQYTTRRPHKPNNDHKRGQSHDSRRGNRSGNKRRRDDSRSRRDNRRQRDSRDRGRSRSREHDKPRRSDSRNRQGHERSRSHDRRDNKDKDRGHSKDRDRRNDRPSDRGRPSDHSDRRSSDRSRSRESNKDNTVRFDKSNKKDSDKPKRT